MRLQFKVLEALVRKADLITHAGDPDREGQLLVDEVLRYLGTKAPVKRILINDLTPPKAVARAIQNPPRDNREFRPLSHSALARQRADWLYGINLTRFYTLSYQTRGGEQGVFSVGRVQLRCWAWWWIETTPSSTSSPSLVPGRSHLPGQRAGGRPATVHCSLVTR